ncbi:unnamed protein product, partial [Ectocarpus sp. 8 AP-2014]
RGGSAAASLIADETSEPQRPARAAAVLLRSREQVEVTPPVVANEPASAKEKTSCTHVQVLPESPPERRLIGFSPQAEEQLRASQELNTRKCHRASSDRTMV